MPAIALPYRRNHNPLINNALQIHIKNNGIALRKVYHRVELKVVNIGSPFTPDKKKHQKKYAENLYKSHIKLIYHCRKITKKMANMS